MAKKLTTTENIDRELAAEAIRKRQRGERPTAQQVSALRRVEKKREEELRWQHYGSIPQKHWREMSGRQAKVVNEQATRYGIPFSGRVIDLPAVVSALHDFLAANATRLTGADEAGDDVALERLRLAKAEIAEMERDRQRGQIVDLDQHRQTIEGVARCFKVETDSLPNVMAEAVLGALAAVGVEPDDPGAVLAEVRTALGEQIEQYMERAAASMRGLVDQ